MNVARRSRGYVRSLALSASFVTILSAHSLAQTALTPPTPRSPTTVDVQPHEPAGAGVQPPVRVGPRQTSPPLPRGALRVGAFESVQVNVDANGNNVVGDAANEPSIAVDPNNGARMAIGWREFRLVTSSFREGGVAYSTDAGVGWNNNGPLTPGTFRSDPVLRSNADGRFFYYSLASGSVRFCNDMFVSENGGRSWSGPAPAIGGDKPWFAIDRTHEDSRGSLYAAWNIGANCEGTTVLRSLDGGLTYEDFVVPPAARLWTSTVAVGADGRFFFGGRGFTSSVPRVAFSTNISDPLVSNPTWITPPFPTLGLLGPSGINGIGLVGQLCVAVDHSSAATFGNVYLLCSVRRTAAVPPVDPQDVYFTRSEDDGLTWSTPLRVNDDPPGSASQWFGMMEVGFDGRLHAVWNDTRNDPNNPAATTSELYYTASTDGGRTWTANQPLSPPFNHTLGYPFESRKLGDYYDMHADALGVDIAYAATFNGEQDVYYLRVGPRDCNRNGIADEQEIAGGAPDCNANGILDACEPDCNNNGTVDECEAGLPDFRDCNQNGVPDACEPDCNRNGVADACDIAAGAADVNQNGVPDSCDPDCNNNARPDDLDIAQFFSADCDQDGLPDECERDCNNNGEIDGCEFGTGLFDENVILPLPLGGAAVHNFGRVPQAVNSVFVPVVAYTDLDDGANESVDVLLNGTFVGLLFFENEQNCDGVVRILELSAGVFNQLLIDGVAEVQVVRRDVDGIEDCVNSRVSFGLFYTRGPLSSDNNNNHIPDECEIPGDLNCNGVVNVADIGGFVAALTDRLRYFQAYPQCDSNFADMNGDGRVTVGDIALFVALLIGE